MKYFISYTTKDKEITIDFLRSFSKDLRKNNYVFIDIIDNDSINKQRRVIEELDDSDVVILIETKSVYKSDWVNFELEHAKFKKIPIKKIKIEEIIGKE